MTILQYITPSRIGGAETYFVRLCEHLRTSGHRVIVLTKHGSPLLPKLAGRSLETHAWLMYGKLDPLTLLRVCRLIRRERVEVINTHLTTACLIGGLAGRLTGVPVVARVSATGHKTFFRFTRYFVAVSEGVKQHLIAQGVEPGKIRVLYNGVDLESHHSPPPSAEAKERLGLPPGVCMVGVVASLSRRKGHRFLLQALTRLDGRLGEVHALFAGEGDQESPLRRLAASLGLGARVHFLGFREDVTQVLSACDVFVLPSQKEGLPNAVMEAMALYRPVIATAIAGLPEIVEHGRTGLLVPPANVEALANALSCLLGDPEFAGRIARNARSLLETSFDQKAKLAEAGEYLERVVAAWHDGPVQV